MCGKLGITIWFLNSQDTAVESPQVLDGGLCGFKAELGGSAF
jgi:hypothetical protein